MRVPVSTFSICLNGNPRGPACDADSTCSNQAEAATRVRARPLPPPSRGFVPQRSKRPRTETKEFRLSSQARHELAALEFRKKIVVEDELNRRASEVIHRVYRVSFSWASSSAKTWLNGAKRERRPVFINF